MKTVQPLFYQWGLCMLVQQCMVVEAVRTQLGWKLYLDMILIFLGFISTFGELPWFYFYFSFNLKNMYKGKISSKMQIFDWRFSAIMGTYWSNSL